MANIIIARTVDIKCGKHILSFYYAEKSPTENDYPKVIESGCACDCRQNLREFLRNHANCASKKDHIQQFRDSHFCCERHTKNLEV
jgi:hypothetical protein